MINSFIRLFKRFAWFKRLNAKITYGLLAKHIPAAEWQFMNYGYVPVEGEAPLPQLEEQISQLYPLQMYHYLAMKASITNKKILEVGSGRGGGASYLAKHLNPKQYIGMDIAQQAVDLANKLHQRNNLRFIQGCAENIPLETDSMDVVINVESSHAYGSVPNFLNEVFRVLKPGGHLLLVDFRNSEENMNIFREQLKTCGLELMEEEDISENVVQAIEIENDQKVERIHKLVSPRYQKLFCQFAGVKGSPFHDTLKGGTRKYGRFVLRKTISENAPSYAAQLG